MIKIIQYSVIVVCLFFIATDINGNTMAIHLDRLCFALIALGSEYEINKLRREQGND